MSATTCGRGCRWHQAGNRTGHCSQCHRTFSGLTTFDAHQTIRDDASICLDPATLLTSTGAPRFRTFTDSEGAAVWRSASGIPEDVKARWRA